MECGKTFTLGDLIDQMDDRMEAALAHLRCNRI